MKKYRSFFVGLLISAVCYSAVYAQLAFFKRPVVVSSGSLPLDGITVDAGYAVTKISTSYAGSCLRVRRSSDNAELDIGFVGNVLDTNSIAVHCGAGNGFVAKWYDQSGNARDVSQGTAGAQPQIYSSGVMLTNSGNGLARLLFSSSRLTNSAGWSIVTNIYCFSVMARPWNTAADKQMVSAGNYAASTGLMFGVRTSEYSVSKATFCSTSGYTHGTGGAAGAYTPTDNTFHLIDTLMGASNKELYADNSLISTAGANGLPNIGSGSFIIGNTSDLGNSWDGSCQMLIFASNTTLTQSTMRSAINAQYTTY